MGSVLDEIREKRSVDGTYDIGGHPHTFVELFGGKIIPMLWYEPDAFSFRHDYYYNSSDNNLYTKSAEWVDARVEIDDENDGFVYKNGRSIKKMATSPDPKQFGDLYYYSIAEGRIYARIVKWARSNNL